jgi:DNA-binding transcriptional LysR family regulator
VRAEARPASTKPRPGTRLRLRSDVLAGTWEALVSGQVDLAIGVSGEYANPGGIELRPLGDLMPSSTASRPTTRWPPCKARWRMPSWCTTAPWPWPIPRSG